MTHEENWEAALIFAKIAAATKEQKYKDLSLDFLNLLYLRGTLAKATLAKEPLFTILHNEKRWAEIINSLS